MNRAMLVCIGVLAPGIAAPTFAQDPNNGTIGVYCDAQGLGTCIVAPPFVSRTAWVIATLEAEMRRRKEGKPSELLDVLIAFRHGDMFRLGEPSAPGLVRLGRRVAVYPLGAQIPFFPAVKATYAVEDLPPTAETLISLYPEILRCVGCNTCRKVCPQEIEVMRYIAAAQRGDIAKVADLSFDCLMCGLCAARCPVGTITMQSFATKERDHVLV